jgi:UDP-N-acetylmuramoylalanine--D-glutamate ligase
VTTLKDRNVLVLGLGLSGLAMARWCVRQGAVVTVADTRATPPALNELKALIPGVRFVAGEFDASLLAGETFTDIFKSPGLKPSSVAAFLVASYADSVRTKGELDLFSAALTELEAARGYRPSVLAVTGTNGKTTVTALLGQLVERAGKTVAVAGNIGPTLLDTLSARLDADSLPEVWVLELSSFQLDGVEGFEPAAATVLNVTQDHLDWHGNMENYAAAKARIFGTRACRVLNRDDALVMAMVPQSLAPAKGKVRVQQAYCTFGTDMPQRPGDFGIEEVNGMAWLVRALDADVTRRKRNEAPDDIHIQRLLPADALRIRGRHNAANALAALALAGAAGCSLAPMLYGLREYRGEPHRVEPVDMVNGVEYFDDSKGTNVGATVAALQGLGLERKLVVILGGDGKGQDFSPLAAPVARFARAVVLIGRDAPSIRDALAATGVPMTASSDLPDAVAAASRLAREGDAVLMSPACASLDMFDNYVHRAQVFADTVRSLAGQEGAPAQEVA